VGGLATQQQQQQNKFVFFLHFISFNFFFTSALFSFLLLFRIIPNCVRRPFNGGFSERCESPTPA
jgi:hypothetical protein